MGFGRKSDRWCGFTLLEVIASVAIMAICLILLRVAYGYRDGSIKDNIAREELALLNCAIEAYKSEKDHYPVCGSRFVNSNAKELYNELSTKDGSFIEGHGWKISDGKIIDPWGNPYVYTCESEDAGSYVLFSMGPNRHIDEYELIDDIRSR
jgi:prepilin-type N-terminal cleavage/methylation domain-containing protein